MKKAPAKKTPVEKVVEKEAPVEGAAAGTAPAKKTAKEIREWAIGEGREVSLRGRISAAIVRFFHDAAAKLPAVGG
ncbi:histone-like nucleoid-structuring protein Lsr2 [Rhodococcus sp. DK176]